MVRVEAQSYTGTSDNLPPYIRRIEDGQLIPVDAHGFETTPFRKIDDYGITLRALRRRLPRQDREFALRGETIYTQYVGYHESEVVDAMDNITAINATEDPDNPISRLKYQSELFKVFGYLGNRAHESIIRGNAVFLPPQRGGDIVTSFFRAHGFIGDRDGVADFELKRLKRAHGNLMVGVKDHEGSYPDPKGDFDTVVVLDDCLASVASVETSLSLGQEIYGDEKRFVVIVAAAAHRGVRRLMSDFPGTFIIVGIPVWKMSKNFYLERLRSERQSDPYPRHTQVGGDFGDWGRTVHPAEVPDIENFHELYPWMKFKSDYRGPLP